MPATFFIGDPHFFHEKVAKLRGFDDPREMNRVISFKWYKQVKEDDTVYVMGDLSAGGMENFIRGLYLLRNLPGRKRFISGNHDPSAGQHKQALELHVRKLMAVVFEKVSDHGHISLDRRQILLSHYPYWASGDGPVRETKRYEQWRLPDLGNYLIHAHTHFTHPTSGSATGREICVSWDAWNRMVDMGDIARLVKELDNNPSRDYLSL